MDLSVIIVNWNAREDLGRCLTALREHAPRAEHEVIVVDNGSRDGSPALVARRFPEVRLVATWRNLGFSAGNNRGLAVARGRYLLLCNPDCFVGPGTLDTLLRYADAHPEIGFLGPRLLNPDGTLQPSCRRFPSVGALLFRNTPLGRLFPRNRFAAGYLMERDARDAPRSVDWLSGACLLVRRAALEAIGPLDERYFMYCEDMDWCRRAHLAGWQVVYLPEAVAVHRIGASSDQVAVPMVLAHHRSMGLYVRKHHGPWVAALATPLIVLRALLMVCWRWR